METLRPGDIRYSQDSIGCRFSDGTPLTCVFAHLINGNLKVTDIPDIEVVKLNGHWWARTGNRRLFLYKKLEDVGVVETIDVVRSWISPTSDSFRRKFTTDCEGLEIVCRQDFLESALDEIVSDWRSGEDLVEKWDRSKRALAERCGYREDSETDQSSDDDDDDSDQSENADDQDEDDDDDQGEDDEDDQSEDDEGEDDEDDQSGDDEDEDDEDDQGEDDEDEDDEDDQGKDDEDEDDEDDQGEDDEDEDDEDDHGEDDEDEDDEDD